MSLSLFTSKSRSPVGWSGPSTDFLLRFFNYQFLEAQSGRARQRVRHQRIETAAEESHEKPTLGQHWKPTLRLAHLACVAAAESMSRQPAVVALQ